MCTLSGASWLQQKSSHHPFWLEFIDFRLIEAEERKADGSSVVAVGCNL